LPQRFEAILIGACESQRVQASVCSHLVARSGVILSISPQSESSTYISSLHLIPEWGISRPTYIQFTFGDAEVGHIVILVPEGDLVYIWYQNWRVIGILLPEVIV